MTHPLSTPMKHVAVQLGGNARPGIRWHEKTAQISGKCERILDYAAALGIRGANWRFIFGEQGARSGPGKDQDPRIRGYCPTPVKLAGTTPKPHPEVTRLIATRPEFVHTAYEGASHLVTLDGWDTRFIRDVGRWEAHVELRSRLVAGTGVVGIIHDVVSRVQRAEQGGVHDGYERYLRAARTGAGEGIVHYAEPGSTRGNPRPYPESFGRYQLIPPGKLAAHLRVLREERTHYPTAVHIPGAWIDAGWTLGQVIELADALVELGVHAFIDWWCFEKSIHSIESVIEGYGR